MRLFIAEKPELAKAIAKGLGNCRSKDGYIEAGNDLVTWAYGHLLSLAEPEDYNPDYKIWSIKTFNIDVNQFKYKSKKESVSQLNIITQLINDNRVSEIVNAGDVDDEGQILIEEILLYAKNKKTVKRILVSDLTEKGIAKSLNDIRDNADFKLIAERGFARSHADWLLGLTLTRAYTTFLRSKGYPEVFSVGRVQTPIISLVINRDREISQHKESYFYTIKALLKIREIEVKFSLIFDEKIVDESVANDIVQSCTNKQAQIEKITNKEAQKHAPLPYSLLDLQAECSNLYKLKPDEVLKITQSLRENHKLITYNRSDCQYLPEAIFQESSDIINSVSNNLSEFSEITNSLDKNYKGKAFNDKNITAHHGIIPTSNQTDISKLSRDELNIYKMIAKRFLFQFFAPEKSINTVVEIKIDEYLFKFTSNYITEKSKFNDFLKKDEVEEDKQSEDFVSLDLRDLTQSEKVENKEIILNKEKTKPKSAYTIATLLKDLQSVAKYIKDDKLRKILQERDKDKKGENGGIGTPATRSNHLKNLFDRGFLIEDNKNKVHATEKAINFIKLLPDLLTTPDMTAYWTLQQNDIVDSKITRVEFLKEIQELLEKQLKEITSLEVKQGGIVCPSCKNGSLIRRSGKDKGTFWWGCSEWKNGCKATFQDEKGKPVLEKNDVDCPACKKGNLIRRSGKEKGSYWWGCSRYKDGCKATFQDGNGKPILEK